MAIPTVSTEWASDAAALKLEPSLNLREFGWSTSDNTISGVPVKPNLQNQNGWQAAVHEWIVYLEDNIGSGGGGGTGKNYIQNPNAAVDALTGVDKTNTSGLFTVDRTTTASELPEEYKGTAYKCSGDASVVLDDYIAWQIDTTLIADADGGPATCQWKVKDISTTIAGEWIFKLWSVSDSAYIGDSLVAVSTGTYTFGANIIAEDDYELHLVAQGASPTAIGLSGITIQPTPFLRTAIISSWQPWDPTNTQGFGTITSRLQWRQNGENFEGTGDFDAGTITGDEAQLELPNSYTIDYLNSTDTVVVGSFLRDVTLSDVVDTAILATHGDTFLNFSAQVVGASENLTVPQIGNTIAANTERITFRTVSVPVNEFARAGVVVPASDLTGQTKNVVLSLSSLPAGYVNVLSEGMAYTDSTGRWKLNFNIVGTRTSGTTGSITIDGVSFAASEACAAVGSTTITAGATTSTGSGVLLFFSSSSTTNFIVSGDVFLDSKPTDAFVGADSSFSSFTASLENAISIAAHLPFNRLQTKNLALTTDTDGAIADLTFNNLIIGNNYEAYFHGMYEWNSTDEAINTFMIHDGSNIASIVVFGQTGAASGVGQRTYSMKAVFKATATTVAISLSGASVNARLFSSSTNNRTIFILEELNFSSFTDVFT